MMGVGKSTVGRFMSKKLKMPFKDLDRQIEKLESLTIKEIFDLKGEPYFRNLEETEILKIIKKKLLQAKKLLNKYKLKHLCVTITTNTSKDSKKIYFAPLRQIDDILIFGIIVYSTDQLKNLNKVFDSSIKVIFVPFRQHNLFLRFGKMFLNFCRQKKINKTSSM